MKSKLIVTIDRDLLLRAKRYARERGRSPSEIIDGSVRQLSGHGMLRDPSACPLMPVDRHDLQRACVFHALTTPTPPPHNRRSPDRA